MKTCEVVFEGIVYGEFYPKKKTFQCEKIAQFEIQIMDLGKNGPVASVFRCGYHLGNLMKNSIVGWEVWFVKRIQSEDH